MGKHKREIQSNLVTGAAGAPRPRIDPALIDAGYQVRAMITNPADIPGIESVRGSISELSFVQKAMAWAWMPSVS